MKKLLFPLLILLILSACIDEEPEPITKMDLVVTKENKLSSGSITAESKMAIIHVWQADNREFDVDASPDIQLGYAYDKESNSFQTMNYGAVGKRMNERIKPGRYFIYVLLPKSSAEGSLAYSYTYFDIKEGETASLSKTFSYDVASGAFEAWEKTSVLQPK
ncbi:lipoprotein [Pontibacter silvestris]|uniref:Lipoprotein n=1 Tax=Pontibacter silvestris TaxID=2305183 RepID=A0ABW4X4X2_9BACT|nr:lipoprotein [Pontibacter silvestris]MCC9134859.1 lipoprotein [Pontibacter silvestris]